jgi:putative DNA primase/helicase
MKIKELQEYLTTLHSEYSNTFNTFNTSNTSSPQLDPVMRIIIIEQINILKKIIQNLKSSTFLNNVCKAIGSYKINPDFEPKIINKSTFELPIKEGLIINLKTLEIRKRNKKDYWSFECPVSFDLNYNLDSVNKFFNDICCNDDSLKDYHQLLWGYLLTGEIKDRSLHIFYGNGCNGKSSITNIFRNILCNFYVSLSEDITIKKSSRGASPELMDLLYSRCGSLPESDKKEELNSKRIKTITGDDEINARHLFGHSIKFKTQCKLIWATNHKPKINIDDQAIIDRIKLIPFKARFDKNQINTDYIKDLQENKLNEFFTWFCIGAKNWYSGMELIPCQIMNDAMKLYISDNDVIQDFIHDILEIITKAEYDKCDKLEKVNNRTKKTAVYAMYNDWIRENLRKDEQLGKKEFYELMDKKCSRIKVNVDCYICKMKIQEENNDDLDGLILK